MGGDVVRQVKEMQVRSSRTLRAFRRILSLPLIEIGSNCEF